MPDPAADLSRRLAVQAEAVCRFYLCNGRRQGRYWVVGDVGNTPGRSLHVRLSGPQSGTSAAGKWTDAATGEHGDLLDLIAAVRRLPSFRDILEEARVFLSLPRPAARRRREPTADRGSGDAPRRLWAMARPIAGTLGEAYLRTRGITDLRDCAFLRFHPRCYYRGDADDPADRARDAWPALIAAVRDLDGTLTGVQRTWLDPSGNGKAPVSTPRRAMRAMGCLLGHGVRFGMAEPGPAAAGVLAAGEGIETMLSLRQVVPALPMVAALSAGHLAALVLPPTLRRLYLARDDDPAGRAAVQTLSRRAHEADIETLTLDAALGDLNEDLRRLGRHALAATVRVQLAPEDVARFLRGPVRQTG